GPETALVGRWLEAKSLLHQVEAVAALHALQHGDFGFAGLFVLRTFLQPGQRRIPVLNALLDLREGAAGTGIGPEFLQAFAELRRRDVAQLEKQLDRDHLRPVLDGLAGRHHLRHDDAVVVGLIRDRVS
ncbi:hypothetical protein CEE85_14430, partial [Lactobacillus crispatus]